MSSQSSPHRKVPMQVLVLSPSRTGTKSMQDALAILLDAPVYHGYEMLKNKPPGRFWLDMVEAKYNIKPMNPKTKAELFSRQHFDEGLGEYVGVADLPCCFLWRELMDAYPDAKVVLVNRDFEPWWRSFKVAAIDQMYHPLTWYGSDQHNLISPCKHMLTPLSSACRFVSKLEPSMNTWTATTSRLIALKYFGVKSSAELTKCRAKKVYEQHYADIRHACDESPGRLLEMRIEEGWEPLCKALIKPIPNVQFPHLNEVEEQHKITNEHRRQKIVEGALIVTKRCLIPMSVVGLALVAWSYYVRILQ